MRFRRSLRLLLGVVLAAVFLVLVLRRTSISELRSAFADAKAAYWLAALVMFALGYALRIERWRLMLSRSNPTVTWSDCAGPFLASFAANNVLPFRVGDALRAFAFGRALGSSSGVVVATLLLERLLDLLMVLFLLGLSLALFQLDSARLAGLGGVFFLLVAVAVLALLVFPRLLAMPLLALGRLAQRVAPAAGGRLLLEIGKSMDMLSDLARGRTMPWLLLWSLLVWLAEGSVFWLTALALPSLAQPVASWLALPIGTLATLIPSTPGYVGTFDFFTARAMVLGGNAETPATAYALLVHLLIWLPPTVAGGLYLLLRPGMLGKRSLPRS